MDGQGRQIRKGTKDWEEKGDREGKRSIDKGRDGEGEENGKRGK